MQQCWTVGVPRHSASCALNAHCNTAPIIAGRLCIEVEPTSRGAWISEELCIGCGICVKKCPFEAIMIINLPKALAGQTIHRYGANGFKLHRLPMPRPSQVLGLVGTNGIGKSTALQVLAGKLKPNLGRFDSPPTWEEILRHHRGSELQNYFTKILGDNIRAITKPQYVDNIPKAIRGNVGALIAAKDSRGVGDQMLRDLQLDHVLERDIEVLSGGELQRFAIAMVAVQEAHVYMFDEPSSYLDVRQRLKAAEVIRSLVVKGYAAPGGAGGAGGEGDEDDEEAAARAEQREADKYVIVVEHDLAVLDYLSDYICVLYGSAGAYGVVTMPFSVREGINIFLAGFVPTENLRFRDESLSFKVATGVEELAAKPTERYQYPAMRKVSNSAGPVCFEADAVARASPLHTRSTLACRAPRPPRLLSPCRCWKASQARPSSRCTSRRASFPTRRSSSCLARTGRARRRSSACSQACSRPTRSEVSPRPSSPASPFRTSRRRSPHPSRAPCARCSSPRSAML